MEINGMILDEVQEKLLYDVAIKCKRENRRDYDEVFKEVMNERIKQQNREFRVMDYSTTIRTKSGR